MLSTTEVQILDAFSVYGVVERVKKIKDYAFVHFQNREEAYKGMEAVNGRCGEGEVQGRCRIYKGNGGGSGG